MLSQSPKPALHCSTPQLPLAQLGEAFGTSLHATAQPPQSASVLVRTSHESRSASQSAQPLLQLSITQLPSRQVGVASVMMQTRPQPPQLSRSVGAISQPVSGCSSQS